MMAQTPTDWSSAYANLLEADQAISDLSFKTKQFSPTNPSQMFTETHVALRALWRIAEDLLDAAQQRPPARALVKLGPQEWWDFGTATRYQQSGPYLYVMPASAAPEQIVYGGEAMDALIAQLDALAGAAVEDETE